MDPTGVAAVAVAVVALVAAALLVVRLRRERRENVRLQARIEADRAAEARVAAAEERSRIAREMHDVIAHTLTVVVAQADGGRMVAAQRPAAAAATLETIADVSRSALADLRGMLGLLRDSDGAADLGVQPTVADIPALVAQAEGDGVPVSFVTTGTPRALPMGAGMALYRVAQEALTNVRKHAGPAASAYLQLAWRDESVQLTVSDDGRGAAARDTGGLGLVGMRERIAAFGGVLAVGPTAGGGYRVRAELPIRVPVETGGKS